tara:strand:- start:295 stop:456 length:162 start_codon:yes stop_codon:yes gene_type:complete
MSNNIQTDLKLVDNFTVSCDGRDSSDGHPRVYLSLNETDETKCPYCSQRFKKK